MFEQTLNIALICTSSF